MIRLVAQFLLWCGSKLYLLIRFLLWGKLFAVEKPSVPEHSTVSVQPESGPMINLKLSIDKKNNRVLFAVSGKDFVDILLSFLTLPMGTVIRLTGKNSEIGCMDALYESVENLDPQYLQTEACKTMLLHPMRAGERLLRNLKLKIDDMEPPKYYRCRWYSFSWKHHWQVSMVKNVRCLCGLLMSEEFSWLPVLIREGNGVFVKKMDNFIITDDLQVIPTSMTNSVSMLRSLGVEDTSLIGSREVRVGVSEVLRLLKRSLLSQTPLTDVFLRGQEMPYIAALGPCHTPTENRWETITTNTISKRMKVKLLRRKSNNEVLCLEAEEDFFDFLLSFLTFPIGSIIKLLRSHFPMGSAENLYRSVINLGRDGYIRYVEFNMLLDPKIAYHFGCENRLLPIEEEAPRNWTDLCFTCLLEGETCLHGLGQELLSVINPKFLINGITRSGVGFVRRKSMLTVTDNLVVRPLSPTTDILDLQRLNVCVSDLRVQEFTMGEKEALMLLWASLTSKSVLSHVFNHNDG